MENKPSKIEDYIIDDGFEDLTPELNRFIIQENNSDYGTIITDLGKTRIRDALFEKKPLRITELAVGDGKGHYIRLDGKMTALTNEIWRGGAETYIKEDDPDAIFVRGIIPTDVGSFVIREYACFSDKGEMIAIANTPAWEKLGPQEGLLNPFRLILRLIVSDTSAIQVDIHGDGVTAMLEDIEKHDKNPNAHDKHFKNKDIHLEPGERDKIYNQVIHFVATLPKEGWKRVGNTFDLEYTVPKELGITITKNMKPTVSSAPDTLMQIIDDEYQILCSQRGGKLTFHALVKPPETTFAIDVYLHRVNEKPEENNLHVSNVLGAETGDGTPLPGPVTNATVVDTSTHQQLSTRGSCTNPTEDYAGTSIIRKRGSIPTDKEDGVLIASGNNITSFTDRNNLEIEVPYYYRFFTFNKAGHYQNEPYYVQLTIPCKAAPGVSTFQVTDASTTSETRVKITVSHPVSVFYKDTVIVRKGGSSAPTSINDGIVIYRGQASTIYDSDGLASNNSYTWRAFTINKKGSVTPSLSSSVSLVPAVAPQVTNTRLEDTSTDAGGYAVTARWIKNRSTTLDHIDVRLKEGSPVESFSDGIKIYSGTGESVEYKTGIKAGGEYYIRAFAVNTAGVPNMELSGATASCVVGGGTPGAITNFRGADSGGTTTLTWTNPTGSSFWSTTKIVMKIGSAPTSMTDGEVVYGGTGTSVVLTNRQNGVVYHYAAFACNSAGQASGNPARCSVTPNLTPTSYEFFTCITSNTEWKPPSNGTYRITCIGKCADGLKGVFSEVGFGGPGGSSGGISRSILELNSSQSYHCTVDNTISSFGSYLSATAAAVREPGVGTGGNDFNTTGAKGGEGGGMHLKGENGGNNGASAGDIQKAMKPYCAGSGGGGANYVLPSNIKYDDFLYLHTQRSLASYKAGNGAGYESRREKYYHRASGDGIVGNEAVCNLSIPENATAPTEYPAFNPSSPMFYGGGCGGGGGMLANRPCDYGGHYIRCEISEGSKGSPGAIIIEKGKF